MSSLAVHAPSGATAQVLGGYRRSWCRCSGLVPTPTTIQAAGNGVRQRPRRSRGSATCAAQRTNQNLRQDAGPHPDRPPKDRRPGAHHERMASATQPIEITVAGGVVTPERRGSEVRRRWWSAAQDWPATRPFTVTVPTSTAAGGTGVEAAVVTRQAPRRADHGPGGSRAGLTLRMPLDADRSVRASPSS
jgi:hypothetical protein